MNNWKNWREKWMIKWTIALMNELIKRWMIEWMNKWRNEWWKKQSKSLNESYLKEWKWHDWRIKEEWEKGREKQRDVQKNWNTVPTDSLVTEFRLWQILVLAPFNLFSLSFNIGYNRIPPLTDKICHSPQIR